MKKFLAACLILLFVVNDIWAAPPGFSGGVTNEYEYQEYVFLSGTPILFKGKVTITEKEKNEKKTVDYKYDLTVNDPDEEITGKLSRKTTFVTTYNKRNDKGQTIADTTVDSYTETVEIKDEDNAYKFELKDDESIQFSKSDVIDNRPASDFYQGNIKGRKYYTINKNEGTVIVDITGADVGYQNFWGNTETQIVDYMIESHRIKTDEDGDTDEIDWKGTVNVQTSDSSTKALKYADNEANFSSFNGGYIRTTNREMVSKYDYDLPKFRHGEPRSTRDEDTMKLSSGYVPKVERLVVPKFRDTGGHWAQKDIEKLYSLDVFEDNSSFFAPDVPMTRKEFTKGIIKACDIRVNEEKKKKTTRRKKDEVEEYLFIDVKSTDPDFEFIKHAVEKGIVTGDADYRFKPDGQLTRAEAMTILIRALGFQNKAPNPGYRTTFSDDRAIPNWAKDSIYMAAEVGLTYGDQYGNVNPNKIMTRGEASAMLVRFLEFLQKDLQRDYRENILYFH